MKYLLTVSFLGTAYCGWQVQKNARSVQSVIQDAAEAVFGRRYPVTGCSRTDSGVHAAGFCCTVETDADAPVISPQSLPLALNRYLPDDVSVSEAKTVPDTFHARYSAERKIYRYLIWNAPARCALYASRAWHCPVPLDVETMKKAAAYLVGKHDFAAFCASGSTVTDTVRTLYDIRITKDGDLIAIECEGDGFLYNMVRILCGTLTEISMGKLSAEMLPDILASHDRSRAGRTLPPDGLYLQRVIYHNS